MLQIQHIPRNMETPHTGNILRKRTAGLSMQTQWKETKKRRKSKKEKTSTLKHEKKKTHWWNTNQPSKEENRPNNHTQKETGQHTPHYPNQHRQTNPPKEKGQRRSGLTPAFVALGPRFESWCKHCKNSVLLRVIKAEQCNVEVSQGEIADLKTIRSGQPWGFGTHLG